MLRSARLAAPVWRKSMALIVNMMHHVCVTPTSGMAVRLVLPESRGVAQERLRHLAARNGVLCGAASTERWAFEESRVTCAACRALIEARAREPRTPREQYEPDADLVPLGRIRGGP